ncbi:unnamed protein product [Rotaria sordida]|uniref:Uncharacterized protein n=1 Tax=Rotaria sordida TaxID=392033 RepID=A0A814GUM2_9BILA|nr:unnamed protein product [Rotaria sordida]CAF3672939.1 unnamed protein product [Rotaria sordida]
MFDTQFRLSPELLGNGTTSDDSSSNGPWPQISLDRLLEQHDITPAQPLSISDTTNNDFWSSSAQFKEFFNNYNRQSQQQNKQIDISSLLSSSPSPPPPRQQHHPQQHQSQQQHFQLPLIDNHIFESQPDPQPLFFGQYSSDNNPISIRRDPYHYQQQSQPYTNRSRQTSHLQRQHHHQQQYNRTAPPVLQIPSEDHYQYQHQPQQQQQAIGPPRYKHSQPPAYVACLNHGINYNGVSGPPILLPPSF